MKITIIKREDPDDRIVADRVIVDEPELELGHYKMGDIPDLSERLSGQYLTVARIREMCMMDRIADRDDEPRGSLFKLSKGEEEKYVYLRSDKALKLILEKVIVSLPDDTELRFD